LAGVSRSNLIECAVKFAEVVPTFGDQQIGECVFTDEALEGSVVVVVVGTDPVHTAGLGMLIFNYRHYRLTFRSHHHTPRHPASCVFLVCG